jgi:hypothetical protein
MSRGTIHSMNIARQQIKTMGKPWKSCWHTPSPFLDLKRGPTTLKSRSSQNLVPFPASSIKGGWEGRAESSKISVATPLWPSVGVKPNTSKVGDLESSGIPECLELNSKAQNTLHWSVFGVIGKVLKRR